MDLSRQAPCAAEICTLSVVGEATCTDFYTGIVHELADMEGVDSGWKVPSELQGEKLSQATVFDRLERFARSPHGFMWTEPVLAVMSE